jgi:predicted transcriptional regulator
VSEENNLVQLTAEIVESMLAGNKVSTSEIPALISSTYAALAGLGASAPEPEAEKPRGAVSIKASIKPDGLVSMIDGKKYQTLRRHITRHGYTPESYREAFGLPRDYPLTSARYSELRRGMAQKIGLGRKATSVEEPEAAPQPAPLAEAPKRGRKPKATAEVPTLTAAAAEPKRGRGRGRPRKAAPAETPDEFFDPAAN